MAETSTRPLLDTLAIKGGVSVLSGAGYTACTFRSVLNIVPVSHMGDRGPALGPSSASLPGALAGSRIGSRAVENSVCRAGPLSANVCTRRPVFSVDAVFQKSGLALSSSC